DWGSEEPLPVDAWILGALLGDGNFTGASVRFSTAAAEMIARLRERLPKALEVSSAEGVDYRIRQRGGAHRQGVAEVNPNPRMQALASLGLRGIGSHDKFIPAPYLRANRRIRLDVLRGLLDTDGWVERWGSVRFSTCSERLARDVIELVRSLGGWCAMSR